MPDSSQIEGRPLARRVVEYGPIRRRSRSILDVGNVAGSRLCIAPSCCTQSQTEVSGQEHHASGHPDLRSSESHTHDTSCATTPPPQRCRTDMHAPSWAFWLAALPVQQRCSRGRAGAGRSWQAGVGRSWQSHHMMPQERRRKGGRPSGREKPLPQSPSAKGQGAQFLIQF